jgi:purine-cytosine permease-like protein
MSKSWLNLFVTGLLIGISMGLLTGHFAVWIAIGAALGVAMAAGHSLRGARKPHESLETVRQD